MKLLNDFGIFAWGTGIGEDVFFKYNIRDEKYQIKKFLPDARVVKFNLFQTNIKFYTYEYIAGNICFSIYRTIWDAAGADRGAYICSIILAKNINPELTFQILNIFSDKLWAVYLEGLDKKHLKYNPDIKHFDAIPQLVENAIKNTTTKIENTDNKIGYYTYNQDENPFNKLNEVNLTKYSRVYLLPDSNQFSFSDSTILPCELLNKKSFNLRLQITDENDNPLENAIIQTNSIEGKTGKDGKFESTIEFETNIILTIKKNEYEPLELNIGDKDIRDNRYTKIVILKSEKEENSRKNITITKEKDSNEAKSTEKQEPEYYLYIKAFKGNYNNQLQEVNCKVFFSDSARNQEFTLQYSHKLEKLYLDDTIKIVANKDGFEKLVLEDIKVSEYVNEKKPLKLLLKEKKAARTYTTVPEKTESKTYTLTVKAVEKIIEDGIEKKVPLSGVQCELFFGSKDKENQKFVIGTAGHEIPNLNTEDEIKFVVNKKGYEQFATKHKKVAEYFKNGNTNHTVSILLKKKEKTNWFKKLLLPIIGVLGVAFIILLFVLLKPTDYTERYAKERNELDSVVQNYCKKKDWNKNEYEKQLAFFNNKQQEYVSINKADENFSIDSINIEKFKTECKVCYKRNLKTEIDRYLTNDIRFNTENTTILLNEAKKINYREKDLETYRLLCKKFDLARKEFDKKTGGNYRWNNLKDCFSEDELKKEKYDFLSDKPQKEIIRTCNEILVILYSTKYLTCNVNFPNASALLKSICIEQEKLSKFSQFFYDIGYQTN